MLCATISSLTKPKVFFHFLRPELEVLKNFTEGFPRVRGLIATTWRSGSTLTGELLNAFPASFYTYEPLSFSILERIYDQKKYTRATINVLKGIFQCNFTAVQNECKANLRIMRINAYKKVTSFRFEIGTKLLHHLQRRVGHSKQSCARDL